MKRIFLLLLAFGALSALTIAQPGRLDLTFNPDDLGFNGSIGPGAKVSAIALRPDGRIIISGDVLTYNTQSVGAVAVLTPDGRLDPNFQPDPEFNSRIRAFALCPDDKFIVCGNFSSYKGTYRKHIARIRLDGSLDKGFETGTGFNTSPMCVAVQKDGKVVVGGSFKTYQDRPREYIVRLNEDGQIDYTFQVGKGFDNAVTALALLPNGQMLVAGAFKEYNGVTCNKMVRLNYDGSIDPTFNVGLGPDYIIRTLVVQPDGKILVGGFFTSFNGVPRNNIARLHPNGEVDTSFAPTLVFNAVVMGLAAQSDGKVIAVGDFYYSTNGVQVSGIVRFNADGALDATFQPGRGAVRLEAVAVKPDGKILVGGEFTQFDNVYRPNLVQLEANGVLDVLFNYGGGFDGKVNAMVLQPDGKIMVSGRFTSYGQERLNMALVRLNSDGSLDHSFKNALPIYGREFFTMALQPDGQVLVAPNGFRYDPDLYVERLARFKANGELDVEFSREAGPNFNGDILRVVPLADGKILVGGRFTAYKNIARLGIARLNANGTLDTDFWPSSGRPGQVTGLAVQSNGRIVVLQGTGTNYQVYRLMPDGTPDPSFNSVSLWGGVGAQIVVLPDDKIMAVGNFRFADGFQRRGIVRLHADGGVDTAFNPGSGFDGVALYDVYDLVVQPNGQMIVVGWFNSYAGKPIGANVARLNPDGSLDTTFDTGEGANDQVTAVLLLPNEKVLIGGWFTGYNGIGRNRIARLQGGTASTHTPQGLAPLKCYPNPTTDAVLIEMPEELPNAVLTVRNALGQTVVQQTISPATTLPFRLEGPTGMYWLEIQSAQRPIAGCKVMKN